MSAQGTVPLSFGGFPGWLLGWLLDVGRCLSGDVLVRRRRGQETGCLRQMTGWFDWHRILLWFGGWSRVDRLLWRTHGRTWWPEARCADAVVCICTRCAIRGCQRLRNVCSHLSSAARANPRAAEPCFAACPLLITPSITCAARSLAFKNTGCSP